MSEMVHEELWYKKSNIKSNILYSDKNAFIRLPQLHIAGLLYSGLEPPIP